MKITALHAQHFLGAPSRPLAFRGSVVCIAGPNGVGKSSLVEAVRFCLLGRAPRDITLKGDYDQLLTFGAKKGAVSVTLDGANTIVRDIKSGKVTSGDPLPEQVEDWLPAVLDAHTFATMDAKAQRSFMFRLLGISMAWPTVKKELEREGVAEELIDVISAPIRGGFESAATFAADKVTEYRAAWRTITGERQYGSNIAASWRAPGADKPEVEVNTKMQEAAVELARSALNDAQQKLGGLNARRAAYLQAQEQLAEAPSADDLADEVDTARQLVSDIEARITKLAAKVQAKGGVSGPCPHCGEAISFTQGEFHKGGAPAAPAELEEHQRLTRELPGHRQALGAAERHKARIDALRAAMPTCVTERDIDDAIAEVREANDALLHAEGVLRDVSADAAAAAEGRRKTEDATAAHLKVEAWTALAKLMQPEGIPTTLLLRGLNPFNARLADLAREIKWPVPRLGPDFQLRVGEQAYRLLSESEQWRVDALIAMAVSIHSGVKLLLLDRFDVLDMGGRNELLGWLGVAGAGVFDTVIVAGTLKDKPVVLTERFGVHVLWLDGSSSGTVTHEEPTEETEA